MENLIKSKKATRFTPIALTSMLMFSSMAFANEPAATAEEKTEKELEQVEKSSQKKLEKKKETRGRYKKVTLSDDKTYYTIDGKEELGPNPVDGESFYVRYSRKKYEGDDGYEDDSVRYRLRNFNNRDGFYLAYSAVSSSGDDLYLSPEENDTAFDRHFSYRVQMLGFFVESPGLNSRRLHGLYASNAWGFNFYNSDNWSFDVYKQTDTEKVEGLAQIQNRTKGRRAGIRATGYFDNSQLQFIYSPYSESTTHEDGIEASLSYTHYWQLKNWNVYGSIGAQYQSKDIVDYYSPEAEVDQSRVNTSAEIGLEYALNEDWVLGAFASYNEIESANSSVKLSKTGSRAGLLLTFVF